MAKLLLDDKTFDLMDWFEEEGGRTRLAYRALCESTHKHWMEWANDVETALLDSQGHLYELASFPPHCRWSSIDAYSPSSDPLVTKQEGPGPGSSENVK